MHDSVTFKAAYDEIIKAYDGIENIGLDSGYKTAVIARDIIESGIKPYFPYKRPMTKKGFLKKYEYVYDEAFDCYLCPNDKILSYTTTNREGRKEYKSNPKDCENCPLLTKCTLSRNQVKVVQRHVWEEYLEEAEEIRHTIGYRDIYDKRKETIERVFADSKESHGLRYTRLRGLKKNQHQVLIIFASHNLKKMANWSWNKSTFYHKSFLFLDF
ncbi:IS1182 family transposase ISBcl1 [bioreactor metagenome]|uniref:IS1182 family transposase ISBcl1 n=1 Tax=bioreactor metagenome TaxID=1076179 RepID=A0A645FS63_9ZZZZ